MPRYRLLEAHYSEEDKWLPGDKENEQFGRPGTEVGDGTEHKWTGLPTPYMVGLDPEAERLVEEAKAHGDGLNPIDFLPMTMEPQGMDELQAQAKRLGYKLTREKEETNANIPVHRVVADLIGSKRTPGQ